jgi:plasmid stabilization system protein ParE
MIYVLRFLPEAEDDAFAAYAWYEKRARGLGDEFLRMFYAGANETVRSPLLSPKVYREFRRRLVRRFPYAIYFRIEHNEIIVFGLFHCARDPRTIGSTLTERSERDTL